MASLAFQSTSPPKPQGGDRTRSWRRAVKWTWDSDGYYAALALRADRRPKPPSLKELALETFRSMQIEPVVINGINVNADVMGKYNIIRRALESLPD
jgi:hypothetical protein